MNAGNRTLKYWNPTFTPGDKCTYDQAHELQRNYVIYGWCSSKLLHIYLIVYYVWLQDYLSTLYNLKLFTKLHFFTSMQACKVKIKLVCLEEKKKGRASLVAQWLRICPLMQGTRVRALVWEDPTCRGATKPVSHDYWACASGACALQQERPRHWKARAPRWRVAPACRN